MGDSPQHSGKFQSHYYIHFQTNALQGDINSLIPHPHPPTTGLNNVTSVLSPMIRETWVQSQVMS